MLLINQLQNENNCYIQQNTKKVNGINQKDKKIEKNTQKMK